MQVLDSRVSLSSEHRLIQQRSVEESLNLRIGPPHTPPVDQVSISTQAKAINAASIDDASDAASQDPKLQLLLLMIEYLTGRKVKVLSLDGVQDPNAPPPNAQQGTAPPSAGFSLSYDYHEIRTEQEQTSFSAEGVVRTADGQEVHFQVELAMSREEKQETHVSLRLGDAARVKDPLVINFSGVAAQLTSGTFRFDLDADGQTDDVPTLAPGSAFLALDRNADGRINDGSELFGPATGDGFAELEQLDADRSGWLDEADPNFGRLRVWSRNADGQDVSISLTDSGVGALFVGRVATPFTLKSADGNLLGLVRSAGIYLAQDAAAGSIQQIDLAV